MFMKLIIILLSAATALTCSYNAQAYEYDEQQTQKLIVGLIKDLGGHETISKNNGKLMRCSYGGTKKVSIVKQEPFTSYIGDYRNCREKDSIRDGLYEIMLNGNEIESSSSQRSINGKLFDAAMEGNTVRVMELIKAKADVNYTEAIQKTEGGSIEEWSPLMSAIVAGKLEIVKALVKSGAWVNYLNSMAVNALWIAANKGDLEIVRYLAKQGAYLNNRNNEDITPLMAAAMNGHLEVVRFLVASKAQLNFASNVGDTALMFALGQKHTEIARLLIDSGADVNIRNSSGLTALMIAVAEGNEELVHKLLEKKADISLKTSDGRTALDLARARGLTGIAELLEKL
ncbi:MAG: ankyrin repeat domain-containing protein [Verrucomicrobia bacterium]|nr:ankyrin repeat domain-containing protein [Deltaproteobacteria bacterium]